MNKVISHSYGGMIQDVSKSKFSNEFYFEGRNIRIVATDTQSTGSLTNEKGNDFILEIPLPVINTTTNTITYGDKTLTYTNEEEIETLPFSSGQKVLGHSNSRHYILLFTTDDNGFDCIWKLGYEDYDLTLLYIRDMNFSTTKPIQVINNFENKNIDKIYWVDSVNQLRFINIEHSIANEDSEELIDLPLNAIDMSGKYSLSQPIVEDVSAGGTHTAGMIQYAYNMYRVNGSQTKISPLSEMVSLDKGALGGGALNEVVSTTPNVTVNDLDQSFTNIKLYSIKYTSYNEVPTISLIADANIPSTGIFRYYDDGRIISTVSIEEFTFLGSDIVIPKHINSKFNRLFLANYTEINFNIDLDTRAYSYSNTDASVIYKDLFLNAGVPDGTSYTFPAGHPESQYDDIALDKHDSVNLNYDTYKYQKDGSTLGGEGKYLKYTLTQDSTYNENSRYFKDNEVYRLGVVFYNIYGQTTDPKWVADFRAPRGNLRGRYLTSFEFPPVGGSYNTITITLKPAFYTWLDTTTFTSEYDKPVGYKFVIAERTLNDRTIVANGLISPMMVNHKTTSDETSISVDISDTLEKIPNILVRNMDPSVGDYGVTRPLRTAFHLNQMNNNTLSPDTEVQRSTTGDSDEVAGRLYQYNSVFQMYSPEVLFGVTVPLSSTLKFNVIGAIKNTENSAWARVYNHDTNEIAAERKFTGGISSFYANPAITTTSQDDGFARGLISHPPNTDAGRVTHNMTYRLYGNTNQVSDDYLDSFRYNTMISDYEVYGTPVNTEKGQSSVNYNNDTNFRFTNSLESVLTDGNKDWDDDGRYGRKIVSISSYGNRCLTFVLGDDDPMIATNIRPKMESLYASGNFISSGISSTPNTDVALIGEFVKPDTEIYLGNLYGGNSYEDKTRTNYIEVGIYKELDSLSPSLHISSPGDTFVRNFRFARIVRTDVNTFAQGYFRLEEIVEFTTETTIDLKNRNDLSLSSWDVRFQPQDAEYHEYNKVYSQLPTLSRHRGLGYNIKRLSNLDTNVIASKLKSNGEVVDSWTDLSVNDVITLDGKFGSINSLTSFNDELFTIQDKAIAFLSINPRVQIQGGDGLSVQLGTGQVLDRYKYISTDTGTLNKWSVVTAPSGIYFYDLLNQDLMMCNGSAISNISTLGGMHTYFTNHSQYDSLILDNPLLKTGVSVGYDFQNNDMFMTFLQGDDSFTIAFNELKGKFTSFYDYIPSMYISKGQYFITTDPTLKKIYRQYAGEYGTYYDTQYQSSITFNVNPEATQDCVFDTIQFKSESYLSGVDQPISTLTSIRAYNDYQDSGLTNLIVGRDKNLRRKFRDWNALIPREGRNRIRAPWIKLELNFANTNNYKFVMHDPSIYYTVS